MRRTTAILVVGLCAVAACRGGAAQEPYDGMIATRRPAKTEAIPTPQVAAAEPIVSEADVPWTIALLSNAKTPVAKRPGRVVVVAAEPELPEATVEEADLRVAVDPRSPEEKPATPKTCSGVVNRRS